MSRERIFRRRIPMRFAFLTVILGSFLFTWGACTSDTLIIVAHDAGDASDIGREAGARDTKPPIGDPECTGFCDRMVACDSPMGGGETCQAACEMASFECRACIPRAACDDGYACQQECGRTAAYPKATATSCAGTGTCFGTQQCIGFGAADGGTNYFCTQACSTFFDCPAFWGCKLFEGDGYCEPPKPR